MDGAVPESFDSLNLEQLDHSVLKVFDKVDRNPRQINVSNDAELFLVFRINFEPGIVKFSKSVL